MKILLIDVDSTIPWANQQNFFMRMDFEKFQILRANRKMVLKPCNDILHSD